MTRMSGASIWANGLVCRDGHMTPAPRLELRQSQNLVMTTQLQQSIKLLQFSSIELTEYIANEIEQNPFLSSTDPGEASTQEEPAESPQEVERQDASTEDVVDFSSNHTSWDETADNTLDTPREAVWADAEGDVYTPSTHTPQQNGSESEWEIEANVSQSHSLKDHLLEQLQIEVQDAAQRMIGLHLVDLVDERGYLPEDLSPVCEILRCTQEEVGAVLKLLQRFDPPGVCARNLSECLAIQLREQERLDPAMEKLLQHLDVMAEGDAKKLARLCGVEEGDIPFMYEEIRALNPKPGYLFGSDLMQPVVPDILLRKMPDGGWHVELNPDALPRVLVQRQYYSRIAANARRKEDKKYLSEQLSHANWLVKALDQRAQTILKVATEIVKQQDAFFRNGVRHFRPLVLRDIAEVAELHESTVSRVTTQKYLSTGSAVYELKYFFSSALGSTDGGEQHSSESVKHLIRSMIEAESPSNILSDDAIAESLQEKGIDIARRTVAKYREAMNIPSSPARRREKKRLLIR